MNDERAAGSANVGSRRLEPLAPVCILAGGLGTRLGDAAGGLPKSLVEVGGRPFLFHQLELLRSHGAERVVICVGHRGELVEAAIGDGSAVGLDVQTVHDGPTLAGTAGAVRGALGHLGEEFLVLYGDTYLRLDYRAAQQARRSSGKPALMTVLRNEGRWDRSNVVYEDGRVLRYDKRRADPEMLYIDYGLAVLTPAVFELAGDSGPDLAEAYTRLADQGELAGFEVMDRFYEIGTPDALKETGEFLSRLRTPERS